MKKLKKNVHALIKTIIGLIIGPFIALYQTIKEDLANETKH